MALAVFLCCFPFFFFSLSFSPCVLLLSLRHGYIRIAKKKDDDPVLWTIVVFIATPFIGLLIYFLRRSEIKGKCPTCGHRISLKAKYCEECGTYIENKEDHGVMVKQGTHHLKFIAAGTISMVLMLVCLTGFIVSAATGNGEFLV